MSINLTGLRIATARVTYAGPGRLDVTAKGKHPLGSAFAPTWAMVEPVIEERKRAAAVLARGEEDAQGVLDARRDDSAELAGIIRACAAEEAEEINRRAWERYVPEYLQRLERSMGIRMDAWSQLQEWARLGELRVGVCFCAGLEIDEPRRRCHRFLWAGHLAGLGATYVGEIGERARRSA